jgi:enoyl-CoA hydratase/carnithine racemase
MSAEEGERWGFYNRIVPFESLREEAQALARGLAQGPGFAHGITKSQLNQEWNVSLETAIEMEAQAQALCMATNDFRRAYEAFAARQTPEFKGD